LQLRQVKRRLGSLFFSGYGSLWRSLNPAVKKSEEIKEVLVINLLRIGDTIVTLPTLDALRDLYPKARLTVVVQELVSSLLEVVPGIDTLISHKGDNSKESCKRLVSRLPAADLAVILDTSPWPSWAARLADCKQVVALDSMHRSFAATTRLPAPACWNVSVPDYKEDWTLPYQGEAWFEIPKFLGALDREIIPKWQANSESRAKARNWLEENNIKNDFLLVHPVSHPSHLWQVERYKELFSSLNCDIVVGGGPEDLAYCKLIADSDRVTIHLSQNLADYGALLSQATYVLSVDTSAAHLAAAVGTELTVLFGAADPRMWAPRGRNRVHVIWTKSGCLGCKAASCYQPSHQCMDHISVEEVLSSLPDKFK